MESGLQNSYVTDAGASKKGQIYNLANWSKNRKNALSEPNGVFLNRMNK